MSFTGLVSYILSSTYNSLQSNQNLYYPSFLRKCAKKITVNALYASTKKSGVKAIKDFKFLFPEVSKVLDIMKSDNKADLPILMQRIESKCVLNHCSKKIAKK